MQIQQAVLGILLVRSELGVLFATDTAAASWTKLVYTQQLKQAAGSILLIGIPLGVCLFRHTAALFICFQCLKKKERVFGGFRSVSQINSLGRHGDEARAKRELSPVFCCIVEKPESSSLTASALSSQRDVCVRFVRGQGFLHRFQSVLFLLLPGIFTHSLKAW